METEILFAFAIISIVNFYAGYVFGKLSRDEEINEKDLTIHQYIGENRELKTKLESLSNETIKNKQGVTFIELLKYLVVVFILTTLCSFAFIGCGEMATSSRYIVKTPYFECTGILYYNPVRFKCDDGTLYYYITNYTLRRINND